MSLAESAWGASTRPPILDRLKRETREAHERLEADLQLLAEPLSRDRFLRVLERFWGFHCIWEPVVARALHDDIFLAPRLKLRRLEADLTALGRSCDEIARLPRCFEDFCPRSSGIAATGSGFGSVSLGHAGLSPNIDKPARRT